MSQPQPTRRQIRKIQVLSNDELDDQIWPVNLAIVILAGFVTGLVLATSSFQEPRVLHNAFFRLGTIGFTLLVWFAGIRWLRGRKMRRRLKICVLFSLLVHLWLLMGLGVGYFELVLDRIEADRRLLEEVNLSTVPDYDPRRLDQPDAQQKYDRPADTDTLRATEPEPPQQRPIERPVPPQKRPEVEPETPPAEQPEVTEMRRREVSAPRRDEAPAGAQISRQDLKVRPEPDRPIPQPEIKPSPQPPPTLVAKTDEVQRRRLQTPRQQRRLFQQEPQATVPRDVAQMARRASRTEPQPERPSTPTPTERVLRPAEVPQTEARVPEPAPKTEDPRTVELKPRSMVVRHRADAPEASKQSAEPAPRVARRVNRAPTQQRQPDWRPQIAETPDRVPARQPRVADLAVAVAEPQAQVAAAASQQPDTPVPGPKARVRRRQPTLSPAAGAKLPSDVPGPAGSTAVAQNPLKRLDRPGSPSLEPAPGPPDRVARSASVAPHLAMAAVERPAVDQPAAAGGSARAAPLQPRANEPRSRSAGLPGNRPSQAVAAVSPLSGQGSPSPPAAARRARASQRGSEGVNIEATAAVGMLRKAQPGTEIPSAAQPMENASTAGAGGRATNSAGVATLSEGGSNTSVQRAAAGAPVGRAAVAAAGSGTLALGPGPVGVMAGRARTGRGGVPALAVGTGAPQLGRSPTGAAGLAGLGGRVAESVPGDQAGGPSTLEGPAQPGPNEAATAVARSGGSGLPAGGLGGGPGSEGAGSAGGLGDVALNGSVGTARIGRARGGDLMAGPELAGGIPGPARRMGRVPVADLAGDVPEALGDAPADGGKQTAGPSGLPEAGTPGVKRRSSGLPGKLLTGMAVDGATVAGPAAGTPGTTVGPRRTAHGHDAGPSLAADVGAAPLGKTNRLGLPSGRAEMIGTAPGPTSGRVADEPTQLAAVLDGAGIGEVGRRDGGLPVRMAAMPGPGGLSYDARPAIGLPSRRARPESDVVHAIARRFVVGRSGGEVAIDGRAQELPREAFRQRDPTRRADQARQHGGTAASEEAVERGLDFLARTQFPDGHWAIHEFPSRAEAWEGESTAPSNPGKLAGKLVPMAERLVADGQGGARKRKRLGELIEKHESGTALGKDELEDLAFLVRSITLSPGQMESDSAATSLALLAFLGAGYTHTDGKHQATVARAIDWLLAHQRPDGDLFSKAGGSKYAWLYSHGIGAIALCEACGMTPDDRRLKEPAQKAIQFILDAQHPGRGGWRYRPREESDTSVSGWQLMALKSAQMAGLEVPDAALRKVEHWLEQAEAPGGDASQYVYNPYAEDTEEQRRGREPSLAMTAEALLMRMYLGWDRDNSALTRGADYLQANLPEVGTEDQPTRDSYYWYYATQVMYHVGGARGKAWNDRLRPLLETSQVKEGPLGGSWHPQRPIADRWGSAGGRHYVTAMNLLMLEVYYRHLPLYKTLK